MKSLNCVTTSNTLFHNHVLHTLLFGFYYEFKFLLKQQLQINLLVEFHDP
ncbi:hypothetical protein Hdeb2414_s0044g00743111 [Helianthus debilis subsp. tardiflorus]